MTLPERFNPKWSESFEDWVYANYSYADAQKILSQGQDTTSGYFLYWNQYIKPLKISDREITYSEPPPEKGLSLPPTIMLGENDAVGVNWTRLKSIEVPLISPESVEAQNKIEGLTNQINTLYTTKNAEIDSLKKTNIQMQIDELMPQYTAAKQELAKIEEKSKGQTQMKEVWMPVLPIEYAKPEYLDKLYDSLFIANADGSEMRQFTADEKRQLGFEFGDFRKNASYASLLQDTSLKGGVTPRDIQSSMPLNEAMKAFNTKLMNGQPLPEDAFERLNWIKSNIPSDTELGLGNREFQWTRDMTQLPPDESLRRSLNDWAKQIAEMPDFGEVEKLRQSKVDEILPAMQKLNPDMATDFLMKSGNEKQKQQWYPSLVKMGEGQKVTELGIKTYLSKPENIPFFEQALKSTREKFPQLTPEAGQELENQAQLAGLSQYAPQFNMSPEALRQTMSRYRAAPSSSEFLTLKPEEREALSKIPDFSLMANESPAQVEAENVAIQQEKIRKHTAWEDLQKRAREYTRRKQKVTVL